MKTINLDSIHPSWANIVDNALRAMDPHYLLTLQQQNNWLPGPDKIFNAFSLPLDKTHYILLGESPYPRPQSANGYAFWDGAVRKLWSENGLTKSVNRATSLRNFIKMLLVANGDLSDDTSPAAIKIVDKNRYVTTIDALFHNLLSHGFLLLNASLVFDDRQVKQHARAWHPFMTRLLQQLAEQKPDLTLLLFGNVAKTINDTIDLKLFSYLEAEHPYNLSFIHNQQVINFFKPLQLLLQTQT